ncbi:DUF924 family protein [Endozoicomonadaceae bacterium StTr2]
MKDYDAVLDVWFGPMEHGMSLPEYRQRWFTGGAAFDALLREQFLEEVNFAFSGGFAEWEQSTRGTLALILVLDQLPRNLFRGTKRAFDGDSRAINLAKKLYKTGKIMQLNGDESIFACMPYQHSESLDDQQQGVDLYKQIANSASASFKNIAQSSVNFSMLHRDIIQRFGRFPHRNQALGRQMTSEEQQWLDAGGERFGQ